MQFNLLFSGDVSHMCLCCYSENNLKSMVQPSLYEGEIEVYSEMLNKCFSIKVTMDSNVEQIDYSICDICISRLRDSYLFRNQILAVQQKLNLKLLIDPIHTDTDALENASQVKQECSSDDEYNIFYLEAESDTYSPSLLTSESPCSQVLLSPQFVNEKKTKKNYLKNSRKVTTLSKEQAKQKVLEYQRRKYAQSIPYQIEKTDLSCNICSEIFTNHKNLVVHMSEHYPKLVCDVCGKFVISKKLLIAHMKSHDTEKVPCQICNKFLKKSSIPRHVLKHGGDTRIYPCHMCTERFPSYNTRIYHMAVAHNVNVKKYKCKICPKVFRFSGGLSTHVRRSHLKERNIPCAECNKLFFSNLELKEHMLKHTKVKSFQCTVCLKYFGRKHTLVMHMKIHNNEKKFKCETCEKLFIQKATLKSHMKIHEKIDHEAFIEN